jgi:nucleoid DNA-binding protein
LIAAEISTIVQYAAHKGRNPRTGQESKISAFAAAKVTPRKALKKNLPIFRSTRVT